MQIRFLTYFVIFLLLFISLVSSIFITTFLLVILVFGETELDPVHLRHALLPALGPQLHLLVSQEALVQLSLDELVSEGLATRSEYYYEC